MKREFVSFPKSGRTWMRFALMHLGHADKISFHHDGFEYNNGAKPPLDFDLSKRRVAYTPLDRIVFMDRDPRDVIVSLYYQVTGRFRDFFGYTGTISDFIRDPYFGAENLAAFRKMWTTLCGEGHALRISYEDCHRDFDAVLGTVLDYFDLPASPDDLKHATDAASFENMRQIEIEQNFLEPWLRPRNDSLKTRRGISGGFTDELSASDISYLNRCFGLDG